MIVCMGLNCRTGRSCKMSGGERICLLEGGVSVRVEVGDKVYVPNEKRPYRVRARDERFIICTKPYNPKRMVRYFIVDLKEKVRGPDNMVFCSGYETDEDCAERLKELQSGEIEVSRRRHVDLDIDIE